MGAREDGGREVPPTAMRIFILRARERTDSPFLFRRMFKKEKNKKKKKNEDEQDDTVPLEKRENKITARAISTLSRFSCSMFRLVIGHSQRLIYNIPAVWHRVKRDTTKNTDRLSL